MLVYQSVLVKKFVFTKMPGLPLHFLSPVLHSLHKDILKKSQLSILKNINRQPNFQKNIFKKKTCISFSTNPYHVFKEGHGMIHVSSLPTHPCLSNHSFKRRFRSGLVGERQVVLRASCRFMGKKLRYTPPKVTWYPKMGGL